MDIQVVRKGTTTNKLTIARDRIELKLTDKASSDSEKWLFAFAKKVVEQVAKNPSEFTLRGRFDWDVKSQQMNLGLGYGQRGQKDIRWFSSNQMGMSLPPEDIR